MTQTSRTIILISGPGGTAFGTDETEQMAQALAASGDRVVVMDLDDVSRDRIIEVDPGTAVTLYVNAHGRDNGGLEVLGDQEWRRFEDVMPILSAAGVPVACDLVLATCHAGAIERNLHALPPVTSVAWLAMAEEELHGSDHDRLVAALAADPAVERSAKGIFLTYLGNALRNKMPPGLRLSGCHHSIDPDHALDCMSQMNVDDAVARARDAGLGSQYGEDAIQQIIQTVHDKGIDGVYALNYGKACVIACAAAYGVTASADGDPNEPWKASKRWTLPSHRKSAIGNSENHGDWDEKIRVFRTPSAKDDLNNWRLSTSQPSGSFR